MRYTLICSSIVLLLGCGSEPEPLPSAEAGAGGAGAAGGEDAGIESQGTTTSSGGGGGGVGGGGGSPPAEPFSCAGQEVVFCDGFESGDLEAPLGAGNWGSKVNLTVSDERARTGSYAARFYYEGNPSLAANADAFAELRFDLGGLHDELWFDFALFVPDNYVHRNAESSDNNKLFRLWPDGYNDPEKVGFSFWPEDDNSQVIADWTAPGSSIGPKGPGDDDFITDSDHGTWMDVRIHVRAAQAGAPGIIELWKNGELAISHTNVDNYVEGEPHAYRFGYFLGWSNSGFSEDTWLFIDDVIVRNEPPE